MPGPRLISSRQHPLVQRCRALARRRSTDELLLDGEHLISDALAADVRLDVILALPGCAPDLVARATEAGNTEAYEISESVLDAASPVRHPSGLLAIASWTPTALDTLFDHTQRPILALVDVQDPGNLGSAIRAADALGAGGVLTLDASADPGGWKALRGAMGSTFRIPVARALSSDAIPAARARGLLVAATLPAGGALPDSLPSRSRLLVLVGNEGAGLPTHLVDAADTSVSVPMRAGVESLNVAVCAALILDGIRRARTQATNARSD